MMLNLKTGGIFRGGAVLAALIFSLFFSVASYAQQNVGIGVPNPDPSSKLDITSTSQGLLLPRMTTAQRNAIVSPANALVIYNITTNCFEWWDAPNTTWVSMSCGGCVVPVAPVAGTSTPSATQIVWNWNVSNGATAYYYNTVNDFSTATNNGVNAAYTQTGLTCATPYTLYVWANSSCGHSPVATLTQTTSACSVAPTCGGQAWMTANMNTGTQITPGASTTQTVGQKWCYNDVAANCIAYGALYQWATAANLPSADNSTLVYGAGMPNCDPCGSGGIQGICPSGYHLPTDLEISRYEYCVENTIIPTGSTSLNTFQTSTGVRGSTTAGVGPGDKMKVTSSNTPAWDGTNTSGFGALPGGSFSPTSASLGSYAHYWSITESSATNAWDRGLYSGGAQINRNNYIKVDGFSVRCLQN